MNLMLITKRNILLKKLFINIIVEITALFVCYTFHIYLKCLYIWNVYKSIGWWKKC